MQLHPVESSNIAAVGHDPDTNRMVVQFKNGGLYEYPDVPVSEYQLLMSAESVGRYYSANIRGKYEGRKICACCWGPIEEGVKGNYCGGDHCYPEDGDGPCE